jgi:hypothetical protein
MKTKVVSTRMTIQDLAKARDGLISKGISASELVTTSQIIKLTFYYGIIYLCQAPKEPASQDSINLIGQKFNQTNATKGLKLTDLEE